MGVPPNNPFSEKIVGSGYRDILPQVDLQSGVWKSEYFVSFCIIGFSYSPKRYRLYHLYDKCIENEQRSFVRRHLSGEKSDYRFKKLSPG